MPELNLPPMTPYKAVRLDTDDDMWEVFKYLRGQGYDSLIQSARPVAGADPVLSLRVVASGTVTEATLGMTVIHDPAGVAALTEDGVQARYGGS